MTIDEAARILRDMYDSAPDKEQVAHVHLFGIKYADQIDGLTKTEIVRRAGLPPSYDVEVGAGRRLAKYVIVKPDA